MVNGPTTPIPVKAKPSSTDPVIPPVTMGESLNQPQLLFIEQNNICPFLLFFLTLHENICSCLLTVGIIKKPAFTASLRALCRAAESRKAVLKPIKRSVVSWENVADSHDASSLLHPLHSDSLKAAAPQQKVRGSYPPGLEEGKGSGAVHTC